MQYWSITDPGCVRSQNQDSCRIEVLDKNAVLCVVCDGMGGAKSGNIASQLALDVFTQEIKDSWKPSMEIKAMEQMLHRAIKLANFTVYDQGQQFEEFAGMGTTLVAALIYGKNVDTFSEPFGPTITSEVKSSEQPATKATAATNIISFLIAFTVFFG